MLDDAREFAIGIYLRLSVFISETKLVRNLNTHDGTRLTRIAAAFIVSGDRLISRIQYRTFAGYNNVSNVDHVTVRHPSSDIRDTQHAS